ncbi:9701_t:CDS:2, partial [Entrophospora sp. SA101]
MGVNSKLEHISLFCEKYPQIANCLMLVYLDLTLVNVEEVEQLQRCIIKGKQNQESMYEIILPCSSAEEWSIDRLASPSIEEIVAADPMNSHNKKPSSSLSSPPYLPSMSYAIVSNDGGISFVKSPSSSKIENASTLANKSYGIKRW